MLHGGSNLTDQLVTPLTVMVAPEKAEAAAEKGAEAVGLAAPVDIACLIIGTQWERGSRERAGNRDYINSRRDCNRGSWRSRGSRSRSVAGKDDLLFKLAVATGSILLIRQVAKLLVGHPDGRISGIRDALEVPVIAIRACPLRGFNPADQKLWVYDLDF